MKSTIEFYRIRGESFKRLQDFRAIKDIYFRGRGERAGSREDKLAEEKKQLAMFPATDNTSGILRTFNKCGGGRRVLFKIIVSTDAVDKIYRGAARGNRPR